MRGRRIGREIVMSFAWQHDQLGARDGAGELVRRGPMGRVGGAVILIVADQDQGRYFNLMQAIGVIMLLARQDKVEIMIDRRDAGHSHLQKLFDQRRILGDELFGPAGLDGVLANVTFETKLHHVTAHGEGNAVGAGMGRAARGENEFLY